MADKIKINLTGKAAAIDGTPIMLEHPDKPKEELTWGMLASKAVANRYKGEEDLGFDKSYERAKLAKKLIKDGDVELTPEQLVEVKRLFAKLYDPNMIFGFCEALGMSDE